MLQYKLVKCLLLEHVIWHHAHMQFVSLHSSPFCLQCALAGFCNLCAVWTSLLVLTCCQFLQIPPRCSPPPLPPPPPNLPKTLSLAVQLGMIDLQAMIWAFAAALTPCNPRLTPTKPTMKLCSKRILLPTLEVMVLACITQAACMLLLKAQDWYHGATASAQQVCTCQAQFAPVFDTMTAPPHHHHSIRHVAF